MDEAAEPAPQSTVTGGAQAPRIHRADPLKRKRAFWIVAGVLALGVLTLVLLQREMAAIHDWLSAGEIDLATQRFLIIARSAFGLLAAVGIGFAIVAGYDAFAVLRERRYPHSRARLIRDREIVEGDRAVLMGRVELLLAAAFIIVAIAGAVYGWVKLATF